MGNVFYIVNKDGQYRLHVKDTHYCLGGCSSPEPLLKTVRRIIKKYKTKNRFFNALSHQEDKGHVNKRMTEIYEMDYQDYEDCTDELNQVVKESLKEVKENTPFKRSQRLLNKVRPKMTETTGYTSDSSPLEEEKTVAEENTSIKIPAKNKLLLKRRRLLLK